MANKQYRDKRHVGFIKRLACLIGQKNGPSTCNGCTEAHHLLKPYSGKRGMSLKAGDENCIPLCQKHHMELHTKHGTEKNLFEHYGLPADIGQQYAKAQFEGAKFYFDQDDDLPF